MVYNGPPGHRHPKGWAGCFILLCAFALLGSVVILSAKLSKHMPPSDSERYWRQREEQRLADIEKARAEAEYWRRAAERLKQ